MLRLRLSLEKSDRADHDQLELKVQGFRHEQHNHGELMNERLHCESMNTSAPNDNVRFRQHATLRDWPTLCFLGLGPASIDLFVSMADPSKDRQGISS